MKRDTLLIHGGEPSPRIAGSAVPPIFQSTVYAMEGTPAYDDIIYPRLNNLPNHEVLAKKLALLEGAEAGLVTASGMAAITTTLLTLLAGGGHLLLQSRVYGGTDSFVREDLAGLGIAVDFIEELDPDDWKRKLRSNTRVIYTEAIGNPLLQVPDHRQVVAFAREHGLTSVVDNTFASPINFRPIEHGYDLSVHSATKYLNGHSDLCAGAVAGSKTLVDRIRHRLNHLGGTLDPHACFLLHRGMKTLSLRVTRQNESALWLAQRLEADDRIKSVLYPGPAVAPAAREGARVLLGLRRHALLRGRRGRRRPSFATSSSPSWARASAALNPSPSVRPRRLTAACLPKNVAVSASQILSFATPWASRRPKTSSPTSSRPWPPADPDGHAGLVLR